MGVRLYFIMAFLAGASVPQSSGPDVQTLLNHLKADRDVFGRGPVQGVSLRDRALQSGSGFMLVEGGNEWINPEDSDPALLGTQRGSDLYLDRRIIADDVAVMGEITNQLSSFNSNESSIVSDSLLKIDSVLCTKPGLEMKPGDSLVIARRGGVMHVGNYRVQIRIDGFSQFITGRRYLLFLKLNKTGSYLVDPRDAFAIDGEKIEGMYTKSVHPAAASLGSTDAFIRAVHERSEEVIR